MQQGADGSRGPRSGAPPAVAAAPAVVTPAPEAATPTMAAPVVAAPAPAIVSAKAGGHGAVRQACAEDIKKFCPQGGKPGPCLKAHVAELSEQCKAARAARKAERAGR